MKRSVYFVFPKYSSFEFESEGARRVIRDAAEEYYKMFTDLGAEVLCFAEDMIAVDIFGSHDSVKWLSVISDGDKHFMKTSVSGFPDKYWSIQQDIDTLSDLVKAAVKRFKVKSLKDCNGDELAYAGQRLSTLNSRIKYVTDKEVQKAKYIVYFKDNNNFCKEPHPIDGDGRIIVVSNLVNHMSSFYYGGVPLSKEDFGVIVRSVF